MATLVHLEVGVGLGVSSCGETFQAEDRAERFGWEDGWEEPQSPWQFGIRVSSTSDESTHVRS